MKSTILTNVVNNIVRERDACGTLRQTFLKGQETKVMASIEKKFKRGSVDLETIRCFVDLILISNDANVYEKYDLKDLKEFLKALCKLFPFDIDLNLEYYHFLFNILNKENTAKAHLNRFSNRINKEIRKSTAES